ncbi:acylphosphatase [Bacillus paralicheniformis]|uniref:acylphosphatase n=1 Tax=Bacillus paralicheniformis TaxID=1648923 RepID=UPI002E208445|nr:acylphosphatase [Bacillus paralicheniformis]MED1221846.1 acylphosphatase [Bacillus paralicheniformis]MED1713039.1 acylphosphatase [Bacillus paralicheniformis]
MLQYRIIVDGRVQGVGFRYFVQMEADKHKLTGWVRNRDNGTVEIRAEGPEESLKPFLKAVQKGSPFSKVTDVNVEETKEIDGFHKFNISY